MGNGDKLVSMDRNGEFVYHRLNSHMQKKYAADTLLDTPVAPYVILLFCLSVDVSVFLDLFKNISYEDPIMLVVQVAGLAFAFDLVPIYLGIQLRRYKQGISKDMFIMWLALLVCVLACALNIALRLMTMDQMTPESSSTGTSFGGTAALINQPSGADATTIALTIFGITLPVLTSVGSFFISYLTYNPLKVLKRRGEEMIAKKRDEIRRLDAILTEYGDLTELADKMVQDDEGKFVEMKKLQRALVIGYCDYVRQRLKEHLATPTAVNALSEETCIAILERLDQELAALEKAEIPEVAGNPEYNETTA